MSEQLSKADRKALYKNIIQDNDIKALAIAWRGGLLGVNGRHWREFYRTWMEVKNYPMLWDIHYTHTVTKQYKISVCMIAGNRLLDVQQSLPLNIKDSEGYPAEFNLIDYGSTDGLEDWVKQNMMPHIESGVLNFYKVLNVKYFSHTHSRNIGFKLGTGDILTNLDVDNFMEGGFLNSLNLIANHIPKRMVIVKTHKTSGNISFYRDDFYLLNGYDEDLKGRAPIALNLELRALEMGFIVGYYKKDRGYINNGYKYAANMPAEYQKYKWRMELNYFNTFANLILGKVKANEDKGWGKATAIKNFKEEISI